MKRLNLGTDITTGLENREFAMVYQPIVRISNGSIVGFEALMRWNHPEYGFVPPDKFIPVAEEMLSITKLTQFALSEACEALQKFRGEIAQSDELYVSVNISGVDIGQTDFPNFLDHVLDQNGLDQRHLRLELTETALVPASDIASANLQRLQEQGFKIAVDDFGTGYSNLAYLKHLPLTVLKIDRAFAGDAHENAVSKRIVRMLVTLGDELGVDIVAEGLETQRSADALRDLGCLFAQGYHYYKPMPANKALDALNSGRQCSDVA
ncbi:EAL domain-containing protein [Rhodobacteraceae bacterium]|nr:EAL domain-containing protein [Paracoccaceae bacterium]